MGKVAPARVTLAWPIKKETLPTATVETEEDAGLDAGDLSVKEFDGIDGEDGIDGAD